MSIFRKLENMFSASAFAEAGEFDTAREMANEPVEDRKTVKPETESFKSTAEHHGGVHPSSTNA